MTYAFLKDPDAKIDYRIDWTSWLGVDGDTIVSSTWSADSAGITVDHDTRTTTSATVWLTGGTLGKSYRLTNRIVTTAGRNQDATIKVTIAQL